MSHYNDYRYLCFKSESLIEDNRWICSEVGEYRLFRVRVEYEYEYEYQLLEYEYEYEYEYQPLEYKYEYDYGYIKA